MQPTGVFYHKKGSLSRYVPEKITSCGPRAKIHATIIILFLKHDIKVRDKSVGLPWLIVDNHPWGESVQVSTTHVDTVMISNFVFAVGNSSEFWLFEIAGCQPQWLCVGKL